MFRFKQFTVYQGRCPMKVGTDGVLLGAWAAVRDSDRTILDIGTGTGLIALMVAQRAPNAFVTGVDVDSVAQARANGDASPWGNRLEFVACRIQDFMPSEGYDLILSNPPFFVESLTCPDKGRTMARHAVSLSFEELRDAVVRLLKPGGRFAVILPTTEGEHFIALCVGHLHLTRRTNVRTVPRRAPKRVLLEFVSSVYAADFMLFASSGPPSVSPSELAIGTGEQECYTSEYRDLTRDFYLKF